MRKAAWVHYRIDTEGGTARGYLNFAFGLWSALRNRMGGDLVQASPGEAAHPRVHLHVIPPHFFRPAPKRQNVLFSMWEGDALPDEVVTHLRRADRLLVPSEYCRQVWRAHGLAAEVVPLGVNDAWLCANPNRPLLRTEDSVLRFLWVGSSLSRKGWDLLAPAWKMAFGNLLRGGVQLYVKTIAAPGLPRKVEESYGGRVVVDTRDLDLVDLLRLYESADVFVFPSYGEGFGLTPLEAMAAGCLVLAPTIGGLSEFVNPLTAVVMDRSRRVTVDYGAPYDTLVPSVEDVARSMRLAYELWGTSKLEDRRTYGTERARRFTWNSAAERLIEVLSLNAPAGPAAEEPVQPPADHPSDRGQQAPDAHTSNVVRFPAVP